MGTRNSYYRGTTPLVSVRFARSKEDREISSLFVGWLGLGTIDERLGEIRKAIRARELIVAKDRSTKKLVGLIHSIIHNDPISSGPSLYITAFYVLEQFRGNGIGSRMLRFALDCAMREGVVGAEVATSHPRAIKLYKKFGFRQYKSEIGEIQLCLNLKRKS